MQQSKQWGTGLFVVVLTAAALIAVASLTPGISPAWAEDAPAGQKLFMDQKCQMCHSVEAAGIEAMTKSEKMKGPDLSDVADQHDAEWLAQYLKKETDIEGKKHMKAFSGSDEELQQLIDWFESLAAE